MIEPRLQSQLGALESFLRRARLHRQLALYWLAAAAGGALLLLIRGVTGWISLWPWLLLFLGAMVGTLVVRAREHLRPLDFKELAAVLERDYPELHPLLSTAVEQAPNAESGNFHFLQMRVIERALNHHDRIIWELNLEQRFNSAQFLHYAALVLFAFLFLAQSNPAGSPFKLRAAIDGVEVAPGDTEIERGAGLVVSARFGETPPSAATLVLISASGKTHRVPLERHLADPVFGGSVLAVTEDALYHVEYGEKKSAEFKIKVFDYPALTRADAHLQFPSYTGQTNKTVPDTRRISAVEGSRLSYTLQLNKPVATARLVSKEQTLELLVQSNAVAELNEFPLTHSARYALELVDTDGRTNKAPADFSFQVLTNRRPDVKIVFPRGDPRVSRLEELQLQAEVSDDFGVLKYGIGFGPAGQEPKFLDLGETAPAHDKRPFTHLLALEPLNAEVDEVISYFAWADDYGPDGQIRRSFSDIFFAEVRPFEEIFRRDDSDAAGNRNNQGQGGGGGDQNTRLAELQKQIVIATWKLESNQRAPQATR